MHTYVYMSMYIIVIIYIYIYGRVSVQHCILHAGYYILPVTYYLLYIVHQISNIEGDTYIYIFIFNIFYVIDYTLLLVNYILYSNIIYYIIYDM